MKRIIFAALVGMLASGPAWGEDVAICTGTLAYPSGRTSDYEFRLVFSRWTGDLIIKGYSESFQLLNDGSANIRAITGENGGEKLDHGSGGICPAAGGLKLCQL
ncbi:MAG: hypothetical protein HQ514_19085 [Rhodospirillales bacterium]|nr:hypothetical protein [Rhodospirillales bacterium]